MHFRIVQKKVHALVLAVFNGPSYSEKVAYPSAFPWTTQFDVVSQSILSLRFVSTQRLWTIHSQLDVAS